MAFQKLFSKRLLNSFKTNMSFERAIFSKAVRSPIVPHESFDHRGFLRPFFLFRQMPYRSSPAKLPEFPTLSIGQDLPEAPKNINNNASFADAAVPLTSDAVWGGGMSFEDVKSTRIVKMELVKRKLKNLTADTIQYSEFLQICVETCENPDQGAQIAKLLDDSGNVVVLGNFVFLNPARVKKSLEQILLADNDPKREEFKQMVKQINDKAMAQVQTELYFGLSFLTILTFGFGFYFWELLRWDVMGIICLFVVFSRPTSFYLYRLRVNQQRLMKTSNFDIDRYKELCKTFPESENLG